MRTPFLALLLGGALAAPITAQQTTHGTYVALGSSYAAGVGLGPVLDSSPKPCGRTANGYPGQIAHDLGLYLIDASCGGATVQQMIETGQAGLPPQLGAIPADATLVTITAGGNDVDYVGDMMRTARLPDRAAAVIRSDDQRPFDALRTRMLAMFRQIHERAPHARIVISTYPAVVPASGTCPALNLTAAQTEIFRKIADRLATVTRETAREGGASVADIAALSVGHDACSTTPWTNSATPLSGVPFHPNAIGAAATAKAIEQALGTHSEARSGFTNPLLTSGPDPWVTMEKGVYYYTSTGRDRIELWRTSDISDLAHAEHRVVWTPPATGLNAHLIWAPELHRMHGKWYLYYTATEGGFKDDAHRGVFVLENSAADPLQGQWIDRGKINTARAGIDGTVFEYRGSTYFAYSPYLGPVSGIALAKLKNPWTIAGKEVVIAKPDKPWEDQGGRQILEGPEFLEGPSGQLFMTYSAGACWSDNYSLGLLHAKAGSDLLSPESWTKSPQPVLSSANGVYATGHNGFFRSPDNREQWIIYHANPGPNMGCTARRSPYLSKVSWAFDGTPQIALPSAAGVYQPKPSGTP